MTNEKRCPRCEETKPLEAFSRTKAAKSGVFGYCKACHSTMRREYNATFDGKCKQVVRTSRYTAKKVGVESTLNLAEIKAVMSVEKCAYCNVVVEEGKRTIDHVQPMQEGGANTFENVVMACHSCNLAKHSRPAYDFIMKKAHSGATSRLLETLATRNGISIYEVLQNLHAQHSAYNEAQFRAKHYGADA